MRSENPAAICGGVRVSRAGLHELTIDGEEWMVISYPLPRAAALAVLTAAEVDVVHRWLDGGSMRRIASERGVAMRTVAKQIASAYEKLGVSSRAELVRLMADLAREGG